MMGAFTWLPLFPVFVPLPVTANRYCSAGTESFLLISAACGMWMSANTLSFAFTKLRMAFMFSMSRAKRTPFLTAVMPHWLIWKS